MSWENFREESKLFGHDMKPHLKRWVRRPWQGHAFSNMFTEACGWPREKRINYPELHRPGYYFGHWMSFLIPAMMVTIIALALT